MKTMTLEYKCRRCGTVANAGTTGTTKMFTSLINIIIGLPVDGNPHTMFDIHHCADGGLGASDVIGAKLD